jgi:hypothetical protein
MPDRSRKVVTWLAVLVAAVAASPVSGRQGSEASKPAAGSVSGRVTRGGKPAPGVAVFVAPDDWSPAARDGKIVARASSGEDGSFRLEGIPAGSYTVSVDAPAFILKGATSRRQDGRSVSLAEGEAVEDFDLVLELGGVVTGRVTTEGGRPVVGEAVTLKRLEPDGTTTYASVRQRVSTDDRGVFRVYGLSPGRYVVGAGVSDDARSMMMGQATRYRLTFHPAAADERQAEPVSVTAGGEATGVDIVLPRAERLRQATGKFVYADTGGPAADVSILYGALGPDGSGGGWASIGKSNEAGEWRISSLHPGRWVVLAQVEQGSPYYSNPVEFRIRDEDAEGLVVTLERGSTLSGRLEIERGSGAAPRLDALVLSLSRVEEDGAKAPAKARPPSAEIGPDGSFALTGVPPGSFRLVVGPWNLSPKPIVVSVERGGVPLDGPIAVREGEPAGDLRVVAALGTGSIRGTAMVKNAPARTRGFAVVRRVSTDSRVASQQVDGRGQFLVASLPAGEYAVRLLYYDASGTTSERRGEERRVTVADGQTAVVEHQHDFAEGTEAPDE